MDRTITDKAIREMTMKKTMMIIGKKVLIKIAHGKAIPMAVITDVKKEKAMGTCRHYGGCLIVFPAFGRRVGLER